MEVNLGYIKVMGIIFGFDFFEIFEIFLKICRYTSKVLDNSGMDPHRLYNQQHMHNTVYF